MQGFKYFSFQTNNSLKLTVLEKQFGIIGIGVFAKLLQSIYGEKGYYCKYNFFLKTTLIEKSLNEETLDKIIELLLNLEVFNQDLFTKYEILTSKNIQDNSLKFAKRIQKKGFKIKKEYNLLTGEEEKEDKNFIENHKKVIVITNLTSSKIIKEIPKQKEIKEPKTIAKNDLIDEIFKHYLICKKSFKGKNFIKSKLTKTNSAKINARLKELKDVDKLEFCKKAINNFFNDNWKDRVNYLDIKYCFKDLETLEKFNQLKVSTDTKNFKTLKGKSINWQ